MRSALFSALALASLLAPQSPRPGRTVDLEAADCSHFQSRWDGFRTAYGAQHTTVPTTVGTLEIRPEENGGVQVLPGGGNSYAITACIAAAAPTSEAAQEAVDAVRIVVDGNKVTTTGAGRRTSIQLVVEAPERARIHATATNGPIAFADVEGTFSAEAVNGPISLRNVRGTATVRTENGPISIRGGAGTVDAEASNGPLGVTLDESRWQGQLTARTHNGPVSVALPEHFASGLQISSSSRSPWSCRVASCGTSVDGYDGGRSLKVGGDPVVVRISTTNGPVAVR